MMLTSFSSNYRAAVFGAGGGVGEAIVRALSDDPRCAVIHAGARSDPALNTPKVSPFRFDLEDENTIEQAARAITSDGPLHLAVVATGLLHDANLQPEKSWRTVQPDAFERAFRINATGPALVAKHILPRLAKSEKAVFAALSAKVGSISDNFLGGWHAYRASKAALNMLIRNFAIELARSNNTAICVALHPGTVDTPLSKPFQANVPASGLFTPQGSAERVLAVIDSLTPQRSGCLIGWDGLEIRP